MHGGCKRPPPSGGGDRGAKRTRADRPPRNEARVAYAPNSGTLSAFSLRRPAEGERAPAVSVAALLREARGRPVARLELDCVDVAYPHGERGAVACALGALEERRLAAAAAAACGAAATGAEDPIGAWRARRLLRAWLLPLAGAAPRLGGLEELVVAAPALAPGALRRLAAALPPSVRRVVAKGRLAADGEAGADADAAGGGEDERAPPVCRAALVLAEPAGARALLQALPCFAHVRLERGLDLRSDAGADAALLGRLARAARARRVSLAPGGRVLLAAPSSPAARDVADAFREAAAAGR